jgi:hypothetical protein
VGGGEGGVFGVVEEVEVLEFGVASGGEVPMCEGLWLEQRGIKERREGGAADS